MTASQPDTNLLWAKTKSRKRDETGYHALIRHLLDVGAVADALWAKVLTEHSRSWIARQFTVDEETARRWVVLLAALHDIGKASAAFQGKWLPGKERLHQQGLGFPQDNSPHGTVSGYILRDNYLKRYQIKPPFHAALAAAIAGHHGVIPVAGDINQIDNNLGLERAVWKEWRDIVIGQVETAVSVPDHPLRQPVDSAAIMWLAGLVSVADWIGSNTRFFKPEDDVEAGIPEIDPASYYLYARQQADKALRQLGWLGWKGTTEIRTIQDLFSFIKEPRGLQKTAVDIAPDLSDPSLVIIEAPMGEGKTEAAMYIADYLTATTGKQGLYFALPTTATSNQMFGRVRAYLNHRYPDAISNLQLLHGQASLSEEYKALLKRFEDIDIEQIYSDAGNERQGAVVAANWFSHRKQGLLAPFGVGTVDQGLLAVLQTRHVFVRLFGLANKTLIIDEIHAYDTYMTSLLGRLLEWCAALGTSVIMLSATLPVQRRDELLQAYAKGLRQPVSKPVPDVPYPRIAWLASDGDPQARTFGTSVAGRKKIKLERVPGGIPVDDMSDSFPLAEQLKAELSSGGCAAVICNTVRRSQAAYQLLTEAFRNDDEIEINLLHARYRFIDRNQRETQAVNQFGKQEFPPGIRPRKSILVATQVIEQSLDLDFDLMVTDFAPVDLMLQRAGRLHRHRNLDAHRAENLREARLLVLWPEEHPLPEFDGGTKAVYAEHALLRTWLAIRDRASISLPDDVSQLIEDVYAEREPPDDLSSDQLQRWQETAKRLESEINREEREATNRWIRSPYEDIPIGDVVPFARNEEEDAHDVHPVHRAMTRLTDGPTVTVICLFEPPESGTDGPADNQNRLYYDGAINARSPQELLMQSLRLSDRSLVPTLLREPLPDGWEDSGLLRYCRMLKFDNNNCTMIGEHVVELHPELGFRILGKEGEEV